jgi:hypothetical protein
MRYFIVYFDRRDPIDVVMPGQKVSGHTHPCIGSICVPADSEVAALKKARACLDPACRIKSVQDAGDLSKMTVALQ